MCTVKILQWNVWFNEDHKNVLELIQKTNADIVCCQELTTKSPMPANKNVDIPKLIAETCGYHYYFHPAIEGGVNNDLILGNAIFSRFPISNERCIYVQRKDPGVVAYDSENRIYIEITTQIGSKNLIVGTTHLSYSRAFATTEKRLAEAKNLYKAVEAHHDRFVLTGDMNIMPNSPIIKKLEEMFILAEIQI
jgi:endonuclease/exonuclease/phosphatase family metal-dependent hydrolase